MKVVTPAVTQASSAKAAGMNETPPFLLTEFNCGLGMDCADSFFSASLLLGLRTVKESESLRHLLCY